MVKEPTSPHGSVVMFASCAWLLPSVGMEGLHFQVSWGQVGTVTGPGH